MIVDANPCPRCDQRHRALLFAKLRRPSNPTVSQAKPYTHWALCPVTREPIMFAPAVDERSLLLAAMT